MAGNEIRLGDGSVRRSPNIPNRDKSVHSRGSGNSPYVRYRHPEFHELAADTGSLVGPDSGIDLIDNPVLDETCHYPNTRLHLIDDFNRVVEPPSYSAGSAMTFSYSRAAGREMMHHDGYFIPWVFESNPVLQQIGSHIGMGDYDNTNPPTIGGWAEMESWYYGAVPTHPADAAGVMLTFSTFHAEGVAIGGWAKVVVMTSEPTGTRQGIFIGQIALGDTNQAVFLPASLIPAAGELLYIGLQPNWQADYGSVSHEWAWPWVTGFGNSGRAQAGLGSLVSTVWQIWDDIAVDFGSTYQDDLACFEGDMHWEWSGDGDGVTEMDGDSLIFTASSPSLAVLTVYGSRTQPIDEDGEGGENAQGSMENPLGHTHYVRFKITTAGNVAQAGERRLALEVLEPRRLTSISAHLGDGDYAEGVSIRLNGSEPEYLAKSITEGSVMCMRIDTRSGDYIRGKMWLESGPMFGAEPVAWDVEINDSEDDDSETSEPDTSRPYLALKMFAGNTSGADQVIEVLSIWAACPVEPCEWVEERLGEFDERVTEAVTSMPYEDGGLWFFLDGFHVQTRPVDSDRGIFSWSYPNSIGAVAVVRYQRAGD